MNQGILAGFFLQRSNSAHDLMHRLLRVPHLAQHGGEAMLAEGWEQTVGYAD